MYKQNPDDDSVFDLDLSNRNPPSTHVVAVRITAENPDEGFKPNGGALHQVKLAAHHQTWGYFSVYSSAKIHDYSDSQFGHVFSQAPTRAEAIKLMVATLRDTQIQADFRTTLSYVAALLEHEVFVNNVFSTAWLDELIRLKFQAPLKDETSVSICAAAVMANKTFKIRKNVILDSLKKRHYPSKDQLSQTVICKFIYRKISFDFEARLISDDSVELTVNGQSVPVQLCESADGLMLLSFMNNSHVVQVQDSSHCFNLIIDGHDCLIELENDPSSIRAPSSGRIVKLLVEDGSKVHADTAICEIEVMKMYMPIYSQGSGTISFRRQIGSSIQAGDLIASIDLEDKNVLLEVQKFSNQLPSCSYRAQEDLLDVYCSRKAQAETVMRGFNVPTDFKKTVNELLASSSDTRLPFFMLFNSLADARNKLPARSVSELSGLLEHGMKSGETLLLEKVEAVLLAAEKSDIVDSLLAITNVHLYGPQKYTLAIVNGIVESFMNCEKLFDTELTVDGPLEKLFKLFDSDLTKIAEFVQMHSQLDPRINCINMMLDDIQAIYPESPKMPDLQNILKALSSFEGKEYGKLTRKTREILLTAQIPSLDDLFHRMETKLEGALKFVDNAGQRIDFIAEMVQGFATHLDVIPRFFHHPNQQIRKLALEIYTKRVFATYLITSSGFSDEKGLGVFEWNFSTQPKEDSDEPGLHGRRPSSATVYPIVGINGESASKPDQKRKGYMVALEDLNSLKSTISKVLKKISERSDEDPNHLYLVAKELPGWSDDKHASFIQEMILSCADELGLHRVRRITLALVREKIVAVGFFTFSQSRDYHEDLTIRHIEPAMAYLLEFPRLANYDIEYCYADVSGQVRIYLGTEKSKEKNQRLFIRLIVRPNQAMRGFESMSYFAPQASNILEEVLQAVEAVQAKKHQLFDHNHLFINIVPVFYNQPNDVLSVFEQLVSAYKDRWSELHIRQVEVRMSLAASKDSSSCRYRFYLDNDTSDVSHVYGYQERKDPLSGFKYLSSLEQQQGRLDGYPVTFYYQFMTPLQTRRSKMLNLETSYVYDFPQIFEHAVSGAWKTYRSMGGDVPAPAKVLEAQELILGSSGELVKVDRLPGSNNVGMVAWRMRLFTPEAPTGRDIIVIANDISFEIGSFGVEEDFLFKAASVLARSEGIPRVYLSANSGARLGLAEEIRGIVKVAWSSPATPEAGFDYLYLDRDDFESLKPNVVNCEKIIAPNGEVRFKILDIIGAKNGLGVENLQGSALIAGETSKAYDEIFTISFVTGRSVGIGAYLVRLGQRVIQKKQHPIILTGVGALNSVLGREVYQSNLQLGGPQIMFANGVSHRVVRTDFEGIQEIIQWLSYVPICQAVLPPVLRTRDNPLRTVTYQPTPGQSYDPRWLIEGKQSEGTWLTGMFDRGSFVETLGGWAKGVVTGRARLGGYPVGVIAVETRTMEVVIPADPANLNSTAQCVQQAGQVWFPDSAFKTAQAIRDFTKGESLPIFILANWRGFSGGQRDLYEQILKFGSLIVDALKDVHQPVFVYLPPEAELRGGAWVVVDSQINREYMEMYADPSARGGILEPEGIVGVKFRPHHFYSLMDRLDEKCHELAEQIEAAPTPSFKEELSKKLAARRAQLLPTYRQIACQFADAHDRPGRMKAKKVIRDIVPWRQSRAFFYHRLRRIQTESELTNSIKGYRLSTAEKKAKLQLILSDKFGINLNSAEDEAIFDSISEHIGAIKDTIKQLNIALAKSEISRILAELPADIAFEGFDAK